MFSEFRSYLSIITLFDFLANYKYKITLIPTDAEQVSGVSDLKSDVRGEGRTDTVGKGNLK